MLLKQTLPRASEHLAVIEAEAPVREAAYLIAGFDIRAFPTPGGSGEGLVIIRVAGSTQAPHGVGRPPEAYVRRGSVKEPLTMRDLHNLFWPRIQRQP